MWQLRAGVLKLGLTALGGSLLAAVAFTPFSLTAFGDIWAPGPNLRVPRHGATSAVLNDGRVLVIGGNNSTGFLDSSEIYDPAQRQWRLTLPLAAARVRSTATLLSDGRVLVTGGVAGDVGPALSSVEVFDPLNEQWMTVASMATARTGHSATLLQDGRVLVVGGYTGANTPSSYFASAEIYEPSLDRWVPVQGIQTPREGHTAALLGDGRVLIAGGGNHSTYLSTAELFNPTTGTWVSAAPMANLRYEAIGAALPNGDPIVIGGVGWPNYLASVEAYDPQANRWRLLAGMGARRWRAGAATLSDGRVVVVGGLTDISGTPAAVLDAEIYEPDANRWSQTAPLSTTRAKSVVAALPGDSVLVAGGHNGQFLQSTEILGPELDLTPPVVTAAVAGVLGANGWFVSDVTVTWTVVDPESPVTSTDRCANFTFGADTPGLTYTCSATSAGGTGSASVFIKRDTSPPAIDISAPANSPTVTANQALIATYACLDTNAGVATCEGPVASGGNVDTTMLGLRSFSVTAVDRAGNTSSAAAEYTVIKDPLVPYLYVTNRDRGHIQIVDPVHGRVVKTIGGVSARPYGVAITPDRRKAYVADADGFDVVVVDLATDEVSRIRVGNYQPASPRHVAISPDGSRAWVSCFWDNSVVAIDTATDAVVARYDTGTGATGVAINPAGTEVYVTNAVADTLSIVDVSRGAVTTLPIGDGPQEVVVSPTGEHAYVALQFEGTIAVLDTTQRTATKVAAGSNVVSLAMAPDGKRLYALRNEPGGTMLALDTATRQIAWSMPFGIYPAGIAVSDDGKYLAANGNGTGQTLLIDPVTLAQRPVSVSTGALGLAFLPSRAGTSLALGAAGVSYGEDALLSATLTSSGAPLAGRVIRFDLNHDGDVDDVATTDSSGIATLPVTASWLRSRVGGAGTHTYAATYLGDGGFAAASASASLVIRKAIPLIAVTGGTFSYDGLPHPASTPTVTGAFGEILAPVSLTYDPGSTAPVMPGSYAAVASYAGDANHEAINGTALIVIDRAVPSISVDSDVVLYSGHPNTAMANATGIDGEVLPVVLAYAPGDTPPVNVGEYVVTATFPGSAVYQPVSATSTLRILPATPVINISRDAAIYDGQPHPASAAAIGLQGELLNPIFISYRSAGAKGTASPGGHTVAEPTEQSKDGSEPAPPDGTPAEQEWATNPPVNAGRYTVRAQFPGAGNYAATEALAEIEILRATPVVHVSSGRFTYDGQPHPAMSVVVGVLGEELGEAAVTYTSDQPPVDAGVYIAFGSYAGSENYEPATGEGQITILRALPTLTIEGGTFVYDGRPHGATVSLVGVMNEDLGVVPVGYQPGNEPPVDGGSYIARAIFAGNANYDGVTAEALVTIQRAVPAVAATGGTFGYDGRPHAASATATGVLGEPLAAPTLSYSPGGGVPTDAGTYEVVARFAGDQNYTPAESTTTVTIDPGAPNVVVAGGNFIYDGNAHSATGTATGINGESLGPLTFTYNGNTAPPVAAGTYDVVGTFAGSANYKRATASTVIQVGPAPLRIGLLPASKTYGQPNPPFEPTYEGFVAGEGPANLNGALLVETAALATSGVGTYVTTPTGLTSSNYVITFTPSTLTIVQSASVTTLTSSSNPAGYLQTVALRADVGSAMAGAGVATGTVEFKAAGISLGSASVTSGAATINLVLDSGIHDVTAWYRGDTNLTGSVATLTQTVNPRNASSTTILRVRPSQSQLGDEVIFEIDVNSPAGTVSGTVLLTDDATTTVIVPLTNGKAAYSTKTLPAGSHAFVARYPGNETTTPSASLPVIHTVTAGARLERTTLRLSPSQHRLNANESVRIDMIVNAASFPSGDVELYLNGGSKGRFRLEQTGAGEGTASTTLLELPVGEHLLMAVYRGSPTHAGATVEVWLRVGK